MRANILSPCAGSLSWSVLPACPAGRGRMTASRCPFSAARPPPRPAATPGPPARRGRYSWAPDAPHSRLIAFDGDLHVVRTITNPRISSPVALTPYPGDRLLITERTGEGVVFDTAGQPVREWESPFPASLYTSGREGARIVASRSPYLVQFVAEDGSAPLVWLLDTLGTPREGIGITHVPDIRYLAQLVNAGPAAVSGDVTYYAPLVRDEILRLDAAGSVVWRSSRGLIPEERDPRFVAGKSRRVEHALINIAMTLGPDGRQIGRAS